MALTRRDFLWTVPLCAGAVWACTRTGEPLKTSGTVQRTVPTVTRPTNAQSILVLMPETAQTRDVWSGLCDELANEFQLVRVRIDTANDVGVLSDAIERYRPAGLIIMNNPTVSAYRQYQRNSPNRKFPPAVIAMTSFLETQTTQLKEVAGISYEVPLITAMTNLRRLVILRTERVAVIVRAPLREFVDRQIALATREKVTVTLEEVSASPNPSEIKRAIRRLKQRADVIWILNDDRLLTPKLITEA
jgi:hypothetical protein